MADLVGAVAALIAELGGPAVLFGMAWSGVQTVRFALDHPDLVTALVLEDSTPGSGTSPDKAGAMLAPVPECPSARADRGGRASLCPPACTATAASRCIAQRAGRSDRPDGVLNPPDLCRRATSTPPRTYEPSSAKVACRRSSSTASTTTSRGKAAAEVLAHGNRPGPSSRRARRGTSTARVIAYKQNLKAPHEPNDPQHAWRASPGTAGLRRMAWRDW
jgi:pimeloyl-ACP methyl ester carboxylesterase